MASAVSYHYFMCREDCKNILAPRNKVHCSDDQIQVAGNSNCILILLR